MISIIELSFFILGSAFILTWTLRFIQTLVRIFLGTKVTPARYGKDSWAIVTGCTDGIGKALALELAKRGFNIYLLGRDPKKLQDTQKEIEKDYGRQARTFVIDFSRDISIKEY